MVAHNGAARSAELVTSPDESKRQQAPAKGQPPTISTLSTRILLQSRTTGQHLRLLFTLLFPVASTVLLATAHSL
jgi:hypothetical protein